jgi:hypothetical protein
LFGFLHHFILKWIGYAVNPETLSVGRQETGMRKIERLHIGGKLARPLGLELFDLFNPLGSPESAARTVSTGSKHSSIRKPS